MNEAIAGPSGINARKIQKKFQQSWLNHESFKGWLASDTNNEHRALCTVCNVSISAGKSELLRHAKREKHRDALSKNEIVVRGVSTSSLDHASYVKRSEIKLCAFFAEHNIPIRCVDHLVPLIKDIARDPQVVRDMSLSRKKCTKIIENVLAKDVTDSLVKILQNQKFSVLIDESTHITDNKILYLSVKYFSRDAGTVVTQLLQIIELDSRDWSAEKLYTVFKDCFSKFSIPLPNIVGVAVDNAFVMVGAENSFTTRLKQDVPNIIFFNCSCRSSALIASKACDQLPQSCEDLLRGVATYVPGSVKRSAILRDLQEFFTVNSKKNLKSCLSRWLVSHQCVERLLENWVVLIHFFQLVVVQDQTRTATEILNMLNDQKIKAYFFFLKYALNFFNSFNALFQSERILIHRLAECSEQIWRQLAQNFIRPELLESSVVNLEDALIFVPVASVYVGPECEHILEKFESTDAIEVKTNCLQFYKTALKEVQCRLTFKNNVVEKFCFLDAKVALEDSARSKVKDLTTIAMHLGDFDITALAFEWRILPSAFDRDAKLHMSGLEVDAMWNKIFNFQNFEGNKMFPNLTRLVEIVLSFPHSNAEAERVFSIVTDVKSNKRSRISHSFLNALCVVRSSMQADSTECVSVNSSTK